MLKNQKKQLVALPAVVNPHKTTNMKKLTVCLLLVLVASGTQSFTLKAPKPKLYEPIAKYFQSLTGTAIEQGHVLAVEHLFAAVRSAQGNDNKVYIVYSCPDNSFRSQEAQILLQSLAAVNQIKKLDVSSVGSASGDVDPRLIKLLQKNGFQVTTGTSTDGKTAYTVKFSDQLPGITLYSKIADKTTLPTAKYYLFKTCDTNESGCTDLPGAFYTTLMGYKSPKEVQDDAALEKEFNTIAAEINTAMLKAL